MTFVMAEQPTDDARVTRIFRELLSKAKPSAPLGNAARLSREAMLTNRYQCSCVTKDGRQCRNFVLIGIGDGRCSTHRRGSA